MTPAAAVRTEYNLVDQAVISAPPSQVWEALVAELSGAGRWWARKNAFTPTHLRPDVEGGLTDMTVRPNGIGKPGPVLRFTARTTGVVPEELLRMDYVSGNFSGSGTFRLRPAGAGKTALSMDFNANPEGWLKVLALVKDIGAEHSLGTLAAFRELDTLLGAVAPHDTPAVRPPGAEVTAATWHGTVETDDGARLAVVEKSPSGWQDDAAATSGTAVLVHGWGGRLQDWDAVATGLLRAGIRVLAMDLRGHGGSSPGSAPITLDQLARDLRLVLAERGVGTAVLVGQSGGGLAALLATVAASSSTEPDTGGIDAHLGGPRPRADQPLDVQGLVLLGTAVHGQEVSPAEIALMGSSVFSGLLRVPALAGRILAATMGPAENFPARQAVAKNLAATPPRVRKAYFELVRGADLRDEASQLTLPVLIMVGEEDRVVPPAVVGEGARSFLKPRIITVPGRGHTLHLEVPDVVVEAVVETFRERQKNPETGRYGSE